MSNARNIASIAGEDVLNASNEIVPVYACRAWVNFDGSEITNPASTTGIRGSANVSSILVSFMCTFMILVGSQSMLNITMQFFTDDSNEH